MNAFVKDALKVVVLTVVVLAVGYTLFPWWRTEPRQLGGSFAAVACYGILLGVYRRWRKKRSEK